MTESEVFDLLMLIVRVAAGVTMAAHGYNKMFKGGKIPGTAGWFDSIGMKPGTVHAYAATITEMGSGVLLAVGLLTPFAGAAFVALMIVAGWTVHRDNGFFIVKSGWEYNMVLALLGLIAATFPGQYTLDDALGLTMGASTRLAIGAGLGIAAGVGQLALFYRPPASN